MCVVDWHKTNNSCWWQMHMHHVAMATSLFLLANQKLTLDSRHTYLLLTYIFLSLTDWVTLQVSSLIAL